MKLADNENMSKRNDKAKKILTDLNSGKTVADIKRTECNDNESDWFRLSLLAYKLNLKDAQRKREEDFKKPNVGCASNEEIARLLELNKLLADFALSLPTTSPSSEAENLFRLLDQEPIDEDKLILAISWRTMNPRLRAYQLKGRIQHFAPFKSFEKIIQAAEICYYRGNYISAYLTLVPIIEGIMLRWTDYNGQGQKPGFDRLRKFFSQAHTRQPAPRNPLFYDVYCKACDKIVTEHLFRNTEDGDAHANFNRHLASHLMIDTEFATKQNSIRLFLLLDIMTEIYWYETCCNDPIFYMQDKDVLYEQKVYERIDRINRFYSTPENELLSSEPVSVSTPYKYSSTFWNRAFEMLTYKKRED